MTHARLLALSLCLLLLAAPASAYVDPGTGSILLQAAIGAITGALAAFAIYWSRVRQALVRLRSRLFGARPRND